MAAATTTRLWSAVLLLCLSIWIAPCSSAASSSTTTTTTPTTPTTRRLWKRLLPRSWRPHPAAVDDEDYTPLLFFTIPRGVLPECDAMEDAVRQVEHELNVRVERLDVLRQPANEALLQLITQQRTPPFLYHRESCQTVHLTPAQAGASSSGNTKKDKQPPQPRRKQDIYINHDRIRAWAKGRHLTGHSAAASSMEDGSTATQKVTAPQLSNTSSSGNNEDGAMDQAELLEELALTPEQLKGKRLMEERTKAKAKQQQKKQK
jgi:hypothetical protein